MPQFQFSKKHEFCFETTEKVHNFINVYKKHLLRSTHWTHRHCMCITLLCSLSQISVYTSTNKVIVSLVGSRLQFISLIISHRPHNYLAWPTTLKNIQHDMIITSTSRFVWPVRATTAPSSFFVFRVSLYTHYFIIIYLFWVVKTILNLNVNKEMISCIACCWCLFLCIWCLVAHR